MSKRESKLLTEALLGIAKRAHLAAASVAMQALRDAMAANPQKLVALIKALKLGKQAA